MSLQHQRQFLSVAEVSRLTGLSVAFWRKAIHRGDISFAKFGSRVLIEGTALDSWIAARLVLKDPTRRAGEIRRLRANRAD